MKEVHKMYIGVLEEEIESARQKLNNNDLISVRYERARQRQINYIEGLQFALDKAKGILPLGVANKC